MFNEKKERNRYSLRKLSIGLASILLGISFISVTGNNVKADTVNSGDNSDQTAIKGSDTAIKIDPKTPEAVTKLQVADGKTAKGNALEAAVKNATDNSQAAVKPTAESTSKDINLIAKQQNTAVKDAAKAAKQGLDTSVVPHNDSNENTLNVKDSNAIAQNMLKDGKENQAGADPAKSKLKMADLLTTTGQKLNAQMLSASKIMSPANDTNGGFDSSWGKLDVNDWQGSVQGDYYQLTDYTGDANHVIVPNEADFAKAGISTSGKQVGVTSDLMHTIFTNNSAGTNVTIAFSKTDNKMVKAINADWSNTWGHAPLGLDYFFSHTQLSKFDGTNLDVSNVTNMSYMFFNSQISDLSSLVNWKVDNVTDMSHMFCSNQISDLSPLANWKVDNVTDISSMFNGNQIGDLSPLANWKVDNVTDMNYMFYNNRISDLSPLANWKVDNVTDMHYMFGNNQISDLSPLANWKVDNVTNMIYMFNDNYSTQTKDLQAKRVINFVYPAGYTGKKQDSITQTVDLPQKVKVRLVTKYYKPSNNILDWVTKTETPKTPDPVYFEDYTVPEIKGLLEPDKTVISRQQADITKPINVTLPYKLADSNTNDAFALDSKHGLHEHINVNDNGGYDADFWGKINVDDWNYKVNGSTITINGLKDGISTGVNDAVIVPNLDDFKLVGKDGGAKTVYISSNALGKTAKHKYYGLSKTNGNTFTTDNNLFFAFYNDNLTHADLNSLNTGNTTNMNYTFYNASSLTSLDVSNWDTNKVTNMNYMFNGASGLTSLDVSNWDTNKVTNMNYMFNGASGLKSLDVSKWNTGNVTNMSGMFDSASSLTNLNVSKWDTSKVTNMSWMFNGASSLTSLDVSKWDTGNVTDMSEMFYNASGLTSLDVSKWDTGNVTDMSEMFYNASGLKNLDVTNWNTGKVTDMYAMFYNASSLTNLDVSKWKIDNVTNMGGMFSGASSLTLIVNSGKFANYLVKNNFADSVINSDVKSVTTDNAKLLQLLTNDVQHDSSTRTIVFTFPANYSPDLAKYHLIKVNNIYQIKQSIDYAKSYLQGTVLINETNDITKHHIDTTKQNKLSNTWQPNYNKLVLAHKNSDGSVSFDAIRLPKVPGYKTSVKTASSPVNHANALFAVSFMALSKPIAPTINDVKPDKAVTPEAPTATEIAKPIKTEPKAATSAAKVIDLSDDAVAIAPKEATWQVTNEPEHDTYRVSNGRYAVELPHISNAQLHVIANSSTKDSILFTYKGQNDKYVFNIKFINGHYLLTTYKIKSGKLVKLVNYNFIKSAKMINVILNWLKLK